MAYIDRVLYALLIAAILQSSFVSADTTVNATYQYLLGTNGTIIETFGSSSNLPAIFSVAQAPGATGIRKIATPWPLIFGQSALSVLIFWIGDKPVDKRIPIPETVWFGLKYCLSMIRSIGGIAFLIIYITHGGTFPSIGIILIYEGFINSSYPSKQRTLPPRPPHLQHRHSPLPHSRHPPNRSQGFNIATVTIDITQGCPNGTIFTLVEECAHPAPYIYSVLTSDDASTIAFWFIGSLLGLVNFLVIVPTLRDPAWFFVHQDDFAKYGFLTTAAGAMLAIGGAAGAAQSYAIEYYDCRNVKQLSDGNWSGCVYETLSWDGNGSGFWDIWVQFTVVVLEGIFAW